MDGLLLKLVEDRTGAPGRWFWKLFGPIRQDLDRLYWCCNGQPWMGFPPDFREEDVEPFDSGSWCIHLWRPGSLARYADGFAEEHIELWAIEPTRDVPAELATKYAASRHGEDVIREHALVWLIYTDSSCWEIYTRKPVLLDRIAGTLEGKRWVEIVRGRHESRGDLFGRAGLSSVWRALNGRLD